MCIRYVLHSLISARKRCMGHVRLAKDMQRLDNMQLTKLAEHSAFGSMETPIFTPEQMSGHEESWRTKNISNPAYLLINPVEDKDGNEVVAGPAGYTVAPQVPPATAALLQIVEENLQDLLGNQEAGEEVPQNISGKAIELIQTRLDMHSFIYMSNMAKAVQRGGTIWLSMAPDIYVEEGRKMKAVGQQGETDSVVLLEKGLDPETGATTLLNDLSQAKLDVTADVGPSSASKRTNTVRSLMGMMQISQDPQTLTVLEAMAMMNMEGEGISDVRDFYRKKLLRMGVVEPTDQEAEELAAEQQNREPDSQDQYLQAEAKKAEAEAKKLDAKAGIPNTPRALRMPITSADRETIAMNGYIIRTINTVRSRIS